MIDTRRVRNGFPLWICILVLTGIAVISVWPLPGRLNDTLPMVREYSTALEDSDPAMFCWNLWWTAGWIEGKHPLLHCHMLHHPFGISLDRHTLTTANGILAWPLTRTAGCLPAHNLLIVFHAFFTAFTMFLLARVFHAHRWAAVIAALIFTWWPARMMHAGVHLNLASTGWLCLTLYLVARGIQRDQWRWFFAAGITTAATGASSWHLLLSLILLIPVIAVSVPDRRPPGWKRLGRILLTLVTGLLVLTPLIVPLVQPDPDIRDRSMEEKESYSIPPLHHIVPPVKSQVFSNTVRSFYMNRSGNVIETTGYIGISVLILALISAFRSTRADRWLLAGAIVMVILSWGPTLHIFNRSIPMPYRWLDGIPGIGAGRTPGRFMIPAGLLLALIAGRTITRYRDRMPLVLVILVSLATVELCPEPMDLLYFQQAVEQNPWVDLNRQKTYAGTDGAILEIPNDWTNRYYLLAQTVHERPITTGFVARIPETVFQRIDGIPDLSRYSDPASSVYAFKMDCEQGRLEALPRLKALLDIALIRSNGGTEIDLTEPLPGVWESWAKQRVGPEVYPLDRWSGRECWETPREPVRWGMFPAARLRIIGQDPAVMKTVTLTTRLLAAQQHDDLPVQLDIVTGGQVINTVTLHHTSGWQPLSVEIPVLHIDTPYQDIWFRFSSGTAPADLPGVASNDHRKLSAAITDWTVTADSASDASILKDNGEFAGGTSGDDGPVHSDHDRPTGG